MSSRFARTLTFLALQRSTLGVFVMIVLVGIGEHMGERFLPIYILALGGGAIVIGLLQAMDNLLSALYSFPGGYLADRLGTKKALLIFNLIALIGFAAVVLIPAWQAVLAGSVLFISWSAVSQPATISLLYKILPQQKRTMGVSMLSMVRRIPMALGPLLGGVFIAVWGERTGVRLAFAAAFVMALVAMFLQQRFIPDDAQHGRNLMPGMGPERHPHRLARRMDPALRRLLLSDILVRFCEQIPYAFVVVWCMKTIAQPVTAVQFGLLTTIEMTVAMLIYIPVARLADRGEKKRYVVITFVFFTLFPLVLLYSRSFGWLVAAFVLRGLKEFGEPTRKSLIMDLCPEGNKAGMFGLYYLIRDVVVSLAAFGGAFLWQVSPEATLLTAFAFGVAGTMVYAMFGRDEAHTALP